MGLIFVLVLTLGISNLVNPSPFLHNAPRALTALASSASASASSPEGPLTHIADLRVKQQKAQRLQAEKQLTEEEDGTADLQEPEEGNNEVSPSLLQKKVFKILTKLRIISSIRQSLAERNNTGEKLVEGSEKEKEEVEEIESEIIGDIDNGDNSTEEAPTFQKVIYPEFNGIPIKLRVGPNEKLVDGSDEIGDGDDLPMGRLEQIGVFFAELVGSIVGLVYGATAQINNSIQGTTAGSIE